MHNTNFTPSNQSGTLLTRVTHAGERIARLKAKARAFYYRVVLSAHACPACGNRDLHMLGPSHCRCGQNHAIDPTEAFQASACCGARLVRKVSHYRCSDCGRVVPSRFLFDERLYDASYFREQMRKSREGRQRRYARWKESLVNARSGSLHLDALPGIDDIPGLNAALDGLIGDVPTESWVPADEDPFDMARYWDVIRDHVRRAAATFDTLPTLGGDRRKDRARRFMTLMHMEQERVIYVSPFGNDLLVEPYETYRQG